MTAPLLAIDDLAISFNQAGRKRLVVDGVSLTIERGEIVTIVGESGSGKTVTALAIARLLGEQGVIERGRIAFNGRELVTLSEAEMRAASLHGAILVRAKLSGTNLKDADLRGADLSGADLSGADLRNARCDEATAWPDGFDWNSAGVTREAGRTSPSTSN